MKKIDFNEVAKYIVKQVQEKALDNGRQYCLDKKEVFEKFNLERTEENEKSIIEALEQRKEISYFEEDKEEYDILLYLDYAPNYEWTEEDEESTGTTAEEYEKQRAEAMKEED